MRAHFVWGTVAWLLLVAFAGFATGQHDPDAAAAHGQDEHHRPDVVAEAPAGVEHEEHEAAAFAPRSHRGAAEEGGHGHEEHGGHEEHHGHGGHEESSATLMTTSYLLIGFLVANFLMLWLVNWPDPHIRSFIWKMMSGTVSIYLAVLINNTISNFFFWVFTGSVEPTSHFTWTELWLQLVLFFGLYVAGNFILFSVGTNNDALCAFSVIGGHISAFAGIGAVSAAFKLHLSPLQAVGLTGGIIAVLAGLRAATGGGALVSKLVKDKAAWEDGKPPEWREKLVETEDDATSIIASFAIMKTFMLITFAEQGHAHAHTSSDIKLLSMAEGLCILALLGSTYWRKLVQGRHNSEHSFGLRAQARAINSVQITTAMTMSWLALHWFEWVTMFVWSKLEHELAAIISAALLTVFSVCGIVLIDRVADKAEHVSRQEKKKKSAIESMSNARDKMTETFQSLLPKGEDGEHSMQRAATEVTEKVMEEALNIENVEAALRKLIDAMSLAVGLAWEHAFHAALHTVVMSNDVMQHHQISANFLMAAASLAIMLPVWLKIIVKMADLSIDEFQTQIDFKRDRAQVRNDRLLNSHMARLQKLAGSVA